MNTTTQLIFATLAILCTSCASFSTQVSTPQYMPSTSLMSRYHDNHHCLRMLNHNCNQYIAYKNDPDDILADQSSSQHDNISPVHHIRQNTDINISSSNTYHQYYMSDHHSITNRVCNTLFSILVSFATAISLGVGVSYALDDDIETNDNIKSSTFYSTSSTLIAENESQDLYVQLGPKVVLSEEERTIRKIVQSTQQEQSEPTVILTNQKDRRSSSSKPKQSPPELKVILDDDSSSSSRSNTPPTSTAQTELKVELENSIPKSEQSSTQSTPSPQNNERPLNMIELSDPKKAEVVTIRPQTMEYIKSYKATEKKSEQAKNDKGQEITVKSVSNDDAKKANTKSKSTTISELFNNIKLFSLGLGVGTVAIMTYQKLNEIDTESVEYINESDIPAQTYQGGMNSGSYLNSLNTSSSPEATLNRELISLDKELTSLGEELTTLDKYLRDDDTTVDGGEEDNQGVAFDGVSCTAFKLDKLSMGEQARRIAEFEASQNNGDI